MGQVVSKLDKIMIYLEKYWAEHRWIDINFVTYLNVFDNEGVCLLFELVWPVFSFAEEINKKLWSMKVTSIWGKTEWQE